MPPPRMGEGVERLQRARGVGFLGHEVASENDEINGDGFDGEDGGTEDRGEGPAAPDVLIGDVENADAIECRGEGGE